MSEVIKSKTASDAPVYSCFVFFKRWGGGNGTTIPLLETHEIIILYNMYNAARTQVVAVCTPCVIATPVRSACFDCCSILLSLRNSR